MGGTAFTVRSVCGYDYVFHTWDAGALNHLRETLHQASPDVRRSKDLQGS